MLPGNNQLTITYNEFSEAIIAEPETGAATDDTAVPPALNTPSSGGGGSAGFVGLTLLLVSVLRSIMTALSPAWRLPL